MYQRTVKLYQGVDNVIQFLFKNADQKSVNVTGWTINFNILSDSEGTLVLSTPVTVINANAGIVTASVTALDLMNLRDEYYNFALTVTDNLGSEQVVYSDDNYGVRGEIHLLSGPYPKFRPSIELLLPSSSNTSVTSSYVASDLNSWQQSVHHTAQFYFDNFTGNIVIQSTLDSLPPIGNGSMSWGNIASLQYTNQTVTDYYNFDGVFTAVRFEVLPLNGNVNPSPVTKILYRG